METGFAVPPEHLVTPRCRHFGACGGCAWQHVAYDEQLRLKRRTIERLVPRGVEVRPALGTPADGGGTPWGYRDKVSFVFGPGGRRQPLVMGHYRRGSRTILPVEECPVHAEAGNRFAFELRDALARAQVEGASPDGRTGIARYVVVRVSESAGEVVGTLVATANAPALRRVTADLEARLGSGLSGPSAKGEGGRARVGFHLNLHDRPGPYLFGGETRRLFGLAGVRERVGGASYLVSPTAFFQTNVRAAGVLVGVVLDALAGDEVRRVLDLYAGAGLFALPLAMAGRLVTAVEESREAVAGAAAALRLNRVGEARCRLVAARVEDALGIPSRGRSSSRSGGGRRRPPAIGGSWDAVVLDPPREGCPPGVLDAVFGRLRPARVVYVSCSPEALGRDLARVGDAGYRFERVQPVDMFPHTEHVETVVVLCRADAARRV